jgi:6-pyruvoyltetrahydropterin/6-carboxytetrahydropterin synthase
MSKLEASGWMTFESGKTYTHSVGLSCTFRQWRAKHSHCRFLHGYALQVTITFVSDELDDNNWVQDFGGLKPIKQWLEDTFDHKTLIAQDDPQLPRIKALADDWGQSDGMGFGGIIHHGPVIDLKVVEHVGCEAFAKMIYDKVYEMYRRPSQRIGFDIDCVEVREHEGNFARYRRK